MSNFSKNITAVMYALDQIKKCRMFC